MTLQSVAISFSQTSSPGNWTAADQEKGRNEMEKVRADIDAFIGTENTDFVIDCILDKVALKYNNFSEADADQDGIQMITAECLNDVVSIENKKSVTRSNETGWDKSEIGQLKASFELQREQLSATFGAENVDDFIDCIVWQIQNEFDDMEEASANLEEISNFSVELSLIFLEEKESTKGNWTKIDEIKAKIALEKNKSEWIDLLGEQQTRILITNIFSDLEESFKNFEMAEYAAAAFKASQEKELMELLSSGISSKGNWNSADLQIIEEDLELIRESVEANIGKEKFAELRACIIETIENRYPNVEIALEDGTGMEKLGEDCFNAINE